MLQFSSRRSAPRSSSSSRCSVSSWPFRTSSRKRPPPTGRASCRTSGMTLGLDLAGRLASAAAGQPRVDHRPSGSRNCAATRGSLLASDNGIGNIITTDADGITVELTDPTQKADARRRSQTLQNNVSSTLGIGGTPELAFGEAADGKLTVKLTADGRHRAHVGARSRSRWKSSASASTRWARPSRPSSARAGPRPGAGAGLRGFLAPQGPHLAHGAPDLPSRPSRR